MGDNYDKNAKYNNIFNRISKRCSNNEIIFIIKRQYFTNNTFYYFLCVVFRFIHLITLSGDYSNIIYRINNSNSFQTILKKYFICFSILKQFNFSFFIYRIIIIIMFIIFITKIIINYRYIILFRNYINTNKWPIPSKFRIIFDHIKFLLFPYIIEFLSYGYYIYIFPNNFFITINDNDKLSLFIIFIINIILIISCNIDNYINMICSNRIYVITDYDAYININLKNNHNKNIAYRDSNYIMNIFVFLQNFVILSNIEHILSQKYKIIFRIVISLIILTLIVIFFFIRINEYNYSNFINSFIYMILLFCFYSIILDLLIFISNYRINNILKEIIYVLIKLFISYNTYLLFTIKTNKFLKSKITEILFQEKIEKNDKNFINSFYYLHQIMINIQKKEINSAIELVKFLNRHINNCNKKICNCKLFEAFINEKNLNIDLKVEEIENYLSNLLIILDYLFESAFIEKDFYNSYDLSILLSEHFCHLKNNPTMAFSIITTLFLKKKNKISKFQMVVLYELSQKYIYYISAFEKNTIEKGIKQNKTEILKNQMKEEIFKENYYHFIISNKVKKLIFKYIDNELTILKYKLIFEDSITFQYDENNESIISAKINFYNQITSIDNIYSNDDKNKIKFNKHREKKSNLYNIIYLLNREYNYFYKIINCIDKINDKIDWPAFMIFKFILLFDIFGGGTVPEKVIKKLYNNSSSKDTSLKNQNITNKEYSILKKKYIEQNHKIDSKTYILVEFKKELRTKYFSEDGALKLGYKQKDIINEKIDILMPREFCKSHQNAIKQLIIGNQIRYNLSKPSFYFNKSNTKSYSANFNRILFYNISKTLMMMIESTFIFENEYRFMLNDNFDLLACSGNFEDEYYLNQKILQAYNIRLLDIIKIKKEKLNKIFEKELKKIQYQKYIKKVKIEEYLIPQFYVPPGEKIIGLMNSKCFNNSKNNILSKISFDYKEEDINENTKIKEDIDDDDNEEKKLITNDNIKDFIKELFIIPGEVVFQQNLNYLLKKNIFIANISKELIKISENDLIFENDKNIYNLGIKAKNLISKLLRKNEFANHSLNISIKFSFYYDKPFYFITINDEKKKYLKVLKTIHFENDDKTVMTNKSSKNKNKIPFPKYNKTKKSSINQKKIIMDDKNIKNKSNYVENKSITDNENNDNKIINKMDIIRKEINKNKFITVIKLILSINIVFILLIYILIIIFQFKIIDIMEQILLAYFYNFYTRDLFLGVHHAALQIYYDSYILIPKPVSMDLKNFYILTNMTKELKEKYHNFTNYFFTYNMAIKHDFNIIYSKKYFTKLRFWKGLEYESLYTSEIDYIIYNIFSLNITYKQSDSSKNEFKNFLFFKERKDQKVKILSPFIKVLFYLCNNCEFTYKTIFDEIEAAIYNSYKQYINTSIPFYFVLEALGLLLYLLFYSTTFVFLIMSNNIVLKNIIFLFLDFSEKDHSNIKLNNYNNVIILKILEFKKLIDDFDLHRFKKYIINLDNINKNKFIDSNNKNSSKNILDDNYNKNIEILEKGENIYELNNIENKKKLKVKENNKLESSSDLGKISLNESNKAMNNSSSQNNLVESYSKFFKYKLNNNTIK